VIDDHVNRTSLPPATFFFFILCIPEPGDSR